MINGAIENAQHNEEKIERGYLEINSEGKF